MDMSVDGKPVSVAIMTSGRSAMVMPVAYRMFGIDEHSPGLQALETDKKGHSRYPYPFREIDV